jgi:hypothetical protein
MRAYQAELFQKRNLSPGTVAIRLAARRFFYTQTLQRACSIAETPYPKKAFHLPTILRQQEVAQLLDAARTPYVPCVLPAGGLSLAHTHWVKSRYRFFLPSQALRRVFRGKFVAALQQAFRDNPLVFPADLPLLAPPKLFAAWLRPLFRKDWVRPASAAGRLRSNGFIESAPEHPATIATLPGSALPIKH